MKNETPPVGFRMDAPNTKETIVDIQQGNRGVAIAPNVGVLTFEVEGVADRLDTLAAASMSYTPFGHNRTLQILGYTVPMWGEGNNLYPQEVYAAISADKMIPEIIEKQVKFLLGKGLRFYREQVQGEGEDQRRVRIPVEDKEMQDWLESWESNGLPHYLEYLKQITTDFYLVKTCSSGFVFNASRRIGGRLPLRGLEYIGADEVRLAKEGSHTASLIRDRDCHHVVLGDWLMPARNDFQIYHRFDPTSPLMHPYAISFNTDKTFSQHIYTFNRWYNGLKEYIKASRLSPKYLNSYLKNALNSHLHIKIPGAWCEMQKEKLQAICQENLFGVENVPLIPEYKGIKLLDDAGKPIGFYESMMDQLITYELRRITELMSGEGKNQGKLYATLAYQNEGWIIEEFPGKYKEFFDTVIKYDERTDKVILTGLGISSSITNVDSSGLISKSGSEVYYNYLLYVSGLTFDEYFVLKDLYRAKDINWPHKKDIKLGFWIDIPAKLQDTAPKDRPANTATADPVTQK